MTLPEVVPLPDLPYRPRLPDRYHPGIGLIGAGHITAAHLRAYRAAGLDLRVIFDLDRSRAEARRDEFFPGARIAQSLEEVLGDPGIEVLDIATHPEARVALIEAALRAGKHVLSQKPFVLDLDTGERLVALARERGLQLAVNQNGRWAPHFSWMREAVRAGLLGEVESLHCNVHFDHNWTATTPFNDIDDLILYDFAIHWFDFAASILGPRIRTVQASRVASQSQSAKPPLFAQVLIQAEGAHGSLVFDGGLRFGKLDTTYLGGSLGSLISTGPYLNEQGLRLVTAAGEAAPQLQGNWFQEGFIGTMTELLCAIEEGREPENSARGNLQSLSLCFAAIEASRNGGTVAVGSVRAVPGIGGA